MRYDPKKIETKWQKKWLADRTYEPDFKSRSGGKRKPTSAKASAGKPFYNLMMFPYPSAEGLHVGNMYAFTGSDIYGRLKRMQGYDVFEPIGLDGFGINSENYALKTKRHPMTWAKISEKNFYRQLQMIGCGFAWDERLETYDPDYYKWTQWIFAAMFKRGLAYRKKQAVNWCPSCKTVLADEQVITGECERCGTVVIKKDLEQWFFRITDYADRLLKNLEKIDWSERVKIAQKNWIGKSEGAMINFQISSPSILSRLNLNHLNHNIEVFTTRPDTLFGATYLVLAPEHEFVESHKLEVANYPEVAAYAKKARAKAEADRIAAGREKTGVELKGIRAINPANNEEIPIFVADYVLGGYGTGAIMAVPAHDERDFEFAKKYKLPIRQVIAPETGEKRAKEEFRDGGSGVVFDPKTQKYAVARWKKGSREWYGLFSGGIEDGEDLQSGVLREVKEESGYHDFAYVEEIETAFAHYHNTPRNVDRFAKAACYLVILNTASVQEQKLETHEVFTIEWVSAAEILDDLAQNNNNHEHDHWIRFLKQAVGRAIELGYDTTSDSSTFFQSAHTGNGILINSDRFSGLDSEEAKWEITKFVRGKRTSQYHLRDWLISRQRYWGPPIPMIFCDACASAKKGERSEMPGWYSVPEKDLPVKLPFIKNFRPTGTDQSPLAAVQKFYKVKCPGCLAARDPAKRDKKWARRETDVSDTFLDSAWYYLRYPSVHKKKRPWDPAITKKWLPVNRSMGGAEHSVLHLLYVRFLAMALRDAKLISFEEPMPVFRAHGLIIKDGAKMSKSKGNIVNPDEYIRAYGADALRMYLMFLAPWEQGGDFRDEGIKGVTRFLDRTWRLFDARMGRRPAWAAQKQSKKNDLERAIHKAVKKVGEDIEGLQYNTAISALMVLLNEFETHPEQVREDQARVFLKLLAPFAPHITEELWQEITKRETRSTKQKFNSIHLEPWPKCDSRLIREDTFDLVIQINGKTRATISLARGASEGDAVQAAVNLDIVKRHLTAKPRRTIFVPDKLINFVVS